MSVIQKIRTKYAKLAGGVIAVALVAFILMDALSSRTNDLFGRDDSAVKVNGEKIDYIEYNRRVQEYEILYGSNQQSMDDNYRAQLRDQALKDLVKEKLIGEQAEKLGLALTAAEKKELIYGNDPDQNVKTYQPFTNPETKRFDPQYVKLFEEQVDQLDPTGKAKAHWESMKQYVWNNSIPKKYETLFTSAMYVPKFIIDARLKQESQIASVDYVTVPLTSIADEDIELSDADMKDYVNRHKEEFTIVEESRNLEYVSFNVIPAAEDTARALGILQTIVEDFKAADDDESFVNRNSDESYSAKYIKKATYRSPYAESIFALNKGEVYGPYFEENNYKLTKLVDTKVYPDSVKCRHILIKTADRGRPVLADSIAEQRMDSVVAAIKGGASFVEMVQKYSDDEGSKNTGGEYTFPFEQKASISKEFADFVFEESTGDKKTVKVENNSYAGYHYIEIIKQSGKSEARQFATVVKGLYAGDNTENDVYARAAEFAATNNTAELFDSATKGGLQKRYAEAVKVNDFTIQGLGPAREIIRWAYNAEVGDISSVFPQNGKYVVVKLKEKKEKGLMPLDDNLKNNINRQVLDEKKAELITEKYNGKDLSEIAKENGKEVQSADSFRGNNSFAGTIGYSPKVVGYSFNKNYQQGALSKGLTGQEGVYYIKLRQRQDVGLENTDSTIVKREQVMLENQQKNGISSRLVETLIKDAKIKYSVDNL